MGPTSKDKVLRVTTEFWVGALCRRVAAEGAFAYVRKRGATEAGAIFIVVSDMQQAVSLYTPAPQTWLDAETSGERMFEISPDLSSEAAISEKLQREQQFDPDIWIIDIEDREGRSFIDVVPQDR